jgi:hypothetical protein
MMKSSKVRFGPVTDISNNSATSSVRNSAASSGLKPRGAIALPEKAPVSLSLQTAMR